MKTLNRGLLALFCTLNFAACGSGVRAITSNYWSACIPMSTTASYNEVWRFGADGRYKRCRTDYTAGNGQCSGTVGSETVVAQGTYVLSDQENGSDKLRDFDITTSGTTVYSVLSTASISNLGALRFGIAPTLTQTGTSASTRISSLQQNIMYFETSSSSNPCTF